MLTLLNNRFSNTQGMGDVKSLDIYIDLAFDEVANLKAVVSTVHLQGRL